MFVDAQTQLDAAHAYSANAVSTNSYDTGAAGNDVSVGIPLTVVLTVGVAAKISGGTETYQFDIIQATDAALTASVDLLASFPFTFAQASVLLAAGDIVAMPVPMGSLTKRYFGIRFVGANTPTITVSAFVTESLGIQMDKYYATRIVVL